MYPAAARPLEGPQPRRSRVSCATLLGRVRTLWYANHDAEVAEVVQSEGDTAPAERGSSWSRWDPHVHLPGTILNDQFQDMSVAGALETLASRRPAIEAIGVTDYMTTASFRRAVAAHEQGAGRSIRFLFPNVELRLDNATSNERGVNLHLLCRPEDVDGLDRFLGSLEFTWSERVYRADRAGLILLGRDFLSTPGLDEVGALRAGVEQFKVNFESLRRAIRTDQWARSSLLVAVAGGQGDGTSGMRMANGSFNARRQSIEGLADIVFSGNPQQVAFWLGQRADSPETLERLYGGMKPCLHGSDGHDAASLGVPDGDRYTWLRGDPTFDTLKLVCLAPGSRCHIGPDSPTAGYTHGRVVGVTVPSSDWFVNGTVPINPGLVAIIGARGTGKTALADLIAAGAGSDEPFNNRSSFVCRAGRLIDSSVVAVEWSHDETTLCNFADGFIDQGPLRPVRYLSQQFVERLCASDGVSDELLVEIERVVFDAWPVENREGSTNFRELLDLRLAAARARQETELEAVLDLSDRIAELRRLRRARPQLEKDREAQRKALERIGGKISALTNNADRTSATRLGAVSEALQVRQEQLQRLGRSITSLESLASRLASARGTSFPGFTEKLRLGHEDAGLSDEQWAAFTIDFQQDVDMVVANAFEATRREIAAIAGAEIAESDELNLDLLTTEQLPLRTVSELQAETTRLRKLVGLDEVRTKQLKDLTQAQGEAQARVLRLGAELERAQNASSDEPVARRLDHYRSYFDALLQEEAELRKLYQPLDRLLSNFGPSVAKLRFTVRRVVDVDAWASRGEELLDLRREGRFRGSGELARVARAELCPAWEFGDADAATEAINEFAVAHSDDLRTQRRTQNDESGAALDWDQRISRWMYSTDHITLRYSLEYDGLSIERLSPGSRGIVLLLLYLAVDQEETDPLIIDQPEENLDPESVYTELVKLFQNASRRRQIIMVTHNANLVVNTDVDQVIVARCGSLQEGRLPELRYQSGGLENPEIRQSVCEVLEGGAEAFRQRARRLGLDLSPPDVSVELDES